jgi:hypothetical protein
MGQLETDLGFRLEFGNGRLIKTKKLGNKFQNNVAREALVESEPNHTHAAASNAAPERESVEHTVPFPVAAKRRTKLKIIEINASHTRMLAQKMALEKGDSGSKPGEGRRVSGKSH